MDKLLSIVVPTKDRYYYLKEFIKIFKSYDNKNTELIIQDNSADNKAFAVYLNEIACNNIYYFYEPQPLSVVENMDAAVAHAIGKYVCILGDDDLYSSYLVKFVEYMESVGLESAIFSDGSVYFWPGMNFIIHPFPNLMIKKAHNTVFKVSSVKERNKCIKAGAIDLGLLPRVYHGVVANKKLHKIFEVTGSYFPGASPDMASSIALSFYVKHHCYCDLPLIISGKSPRSVVGKRGRHPADEIDNVTHLPKNINETWPIFLPRLWSAGTVWAQSLFEAMGKLGHEDELIDFNYAACYANVAIFESAYREKLIPLLKGNYFLIVRFLLECVKLSFFRCKIFLKNFALSRLHLTHMYVKDHVKGSYEAAKIVNDYIKSAIKERK